MYEYQPITECFIYFLFLIVLINWLFVCYLFVLATPIKRPLIIGEIIGAQSMLDESYYRGKVLKKVDDTTYFIQFIDFGDKDNVPISNIFEIPKQYSVI